MYIRGKPPIENDEPQPEPATITIVKKVPSGDAQTVLLFLLNCGEAEKNFQLDGGSDHTAPSERVFTLDPLLFGTYSVTETLAVDFDSVLVVTDADSGAPLLDAVVFCRQTAQSSVSSSLRLQPSTKNS